MVFCPGGKRIRPILTLAAGEWLGAAQAHLLSFACAVEMTPVDSLIHDDLLVLDDDDLRRGAPAAHKVFGEGMAERRGDARRDAGTGRASNSRIGAGCGRLGLGRQVGA